MKQAGTYDFVRVHGHNGAFPIFVAQKMATSDPYDHEAILRKRCNEFRTGDPRPDSCSNGHALDANELQFLFGNALNFQA